MTEGRDSWDAVTVGRLPILTVLRQAFLTPIRYPRQIVVTVLVAAAVTGALVAVLRVIGGEHVDLDNLAPGGIQDAIEASGLGIRGALAVMTVMLAGVLMGAVGLFNYWVRLTLLGRGGVWRQSPGEWAVQTFSNFALFVLIFLAISLYSVSAAFAYVFIGFAGATMPVARLASSFTAWGVLSYAGFMLVACLLFSAFSTALVRGAMWRSHGGGAPWRLKASGGIKRLTIIFLVIVIVFDIVSSVIDAGVRTLSGPGGTAVTAFVFGVLFMCVIAAAHASAYRITTGHGGEAQETSPAAQDPAA